VSAVQVVTLFLDRDLESLSHYSPMSTPLTIDDAAAAAFSDKLILTAIQEKQLDVLNVYAGFLLATLSVASMVLTVASATEHVETNRTTLVALMEHTLSILKTMDQSELDRIKAHFAAAGIVSEAVH
jgi:uncharacterized membrane protein